MPLLPPSILFFSFRLVDSPGSLGRARSTAAKHFDAIYEVKQPYKIHIDAPPIRLRLTALYKFALYCIVLYCIVLSVIPSAEISVHAEFSHCRNSEELTLWITGHSSAALKVGGGPCALGPPHCQKVGGHPRTPTGSPLLTCSSYRTSCSRHEHTLHQLTHDRPIGLAQEKRNRRRHFPS